MFRHIAHIMEKLTKLNFSLININHNILQSAQVASQTSIHAVLLRVFCKGDMGKHSLPGSMAAEMRDWASRTLFMASSISLLEASVFSPGFKFSPAANGFNLQIPSII